MVTGANQAVAQHRWFIEDIEPGIQVERCKCGASHYLLSIGHDNPAYEVTAERVKVLNATRETGDPTCNRARAAAPTKTTQPPEPAPKPTTEVPPIEKPAKPTHNKPRRVACFVCQFAYEHDGQKWCGSKRCPARVSMRKRLPYRPAEPLAPPAEPAKQTGKITNEITKPRSTKPITVSGMGLPPWSEAWPPDVKIAWLNVYRDISLGVKHN